MSTLLKAALGSLLFLTACGQSASGPPMRSAHAGTVAPVEALGSACARLGRVDVSAVRGDCAVPPTAPLGEAECREQMASCSAAEAQALGRFASCLESLPACQAGGEAAFQRAAEACGALLRDVGCAGGRV